MDVRSSCLFITILQILLTTTIESATLPRSPCPQVFAYNTSNTQSDRWYGEILIRTDTTLSGFWIDVELDRPAHLLGNYIAEVTSSDNQEFKIQDLDRRLARGSITPVQIYVKFSETSTVPALRVIRLNGRQICPAEGEENDPEGLLEPQTETGSSEYDVNQQPHRNIRPVTHNDRGTQPQIVSHEVRGTQPQTNTYNNKGTQTQTSSHNRGTQPQIVSHNDRVPQRDTQTQTGSKTETYVPISHNNRDNLNTDRTKPQISSHNDRDSIPHRGSEGSIYQRPTQASRIPVPQSSLINTGHSVSDYGLTDSERRGSQPQIGNESHRGSIADRNSGETNNGGSGTQYSGIVSGSQPQRGTETQYSTNVHGSSNVNYGSDTNRDRDVNRGSTSNRGTQTERESNRGSEVHRNSVPLINPEAHVNKNPNRNTDFVTEPHRGNNWDEIPQRGTETHRDQSYNNRHDSQGTVVYTSLDQDIRTTTERYELKPVTPHSSSRPGVRPGHTPLSNSNVRPSEPASSDYYEWGVRRTTKTTRRTTPQPHRTGLNDRIASNEQCGKVSIRPVALISRGTPTRSGDYPWHAAIYRPEGIDLRYICGATLVSLSTLVTAAHCVTRQSTGRPVNPDSLVVYLGKHSLRRWTGNEQTATVSEVVIHPEYNHTAFQADLALLRLSTPVTYNDFVRPVCLWDSRRSSIESVVARRGTVVGWGYDEYQVVTDELMQAQMPVVTKLECIHSYPTFFSRFVTDLTYCAGFRNGTTACNGDSGGGMVFLEEGLDINEESVWRLRGVVSIGVSITDQFVCDYNHYIVFTDVAQFLPWLRDNI